MLSTFAASSAVQILGGRGITQGGMGVYVERFQRTQKFDAIVRSSLRLLCVYRADPFQCDCSSVVPKRVSPIHFFLLPARTRPC